MPSRNVLFVFLCVLVSACASDVPASTMSSSTRSDQQWKEMLTEEQYRITRRASTERPFENAYWDEKRPGTYYDVTGEQALFRSEDKFDSGTGWPSFTKPIDEDVITTKTDWKIGFPRTEVLSSMHGHHLGHVFTDGPEPTGLRYCMNSAALKFVPDEEEERI